VGIAQSNGTLIITTDADCIWAKPEWLSTIADYYIQHQPALIVMPVSILEKNHFIEIFQSLDFTDPTRHYRMLAVHKGAHSMCNGANLAYTKKRHPNYGGWIQGKSIALPPVKVMTCCSCIRYTWRFNGVLPT
jgi:hypothetical protein